MATNRCLLVWGLGALPLAARRGGGGGGDGQFASSVHIRAATFARGSLHTFARDFGTWGRGATNFRAPLLNFSGDPCKATLNPKPKTRNPKPQTLRVGGFMATRRAQDPWLKECTSWLPKQKIPSKGLGFRV